MPDIPLTRPDITELEQQAVKDTLRSGFISCFSECERLEKAVEGIVGGYCVAVSSASAGLYMAMKVSGVQAGDRVFMGAFTHPSPAYAAYMLGAMVIPIDVAEGSFSIDPAQLDAAAGRHGMPGAIVVVDGLGTLGPVEAVKQWAGRHKSVVIEDAACALGVEGVLKHADIGVFSFHPRKVATGGEGGCVCTKSREIAEDLRRMRNFGLKRAGFGPVFDAFGFNFRMSDINAAVARVQVSRLQEMIEKRKRIVDFYVKELKDNSKLEIPGPFLSKQQNYQTFGIISRMKGEELVARLAEYGVQGSAAAHDLCEQPFFKQLWQGKGMDFECPEANRLANFMVALPLGSNMELQQAQKVVNALKEIL